MQLSNPQPAVTIFVPSAVYVMARASAVPPRIHRIFGRSACAGLLVARKAISRRSQRVIRGKLPERVMCLFSVG